MINIFSIVLRTSLYATVVGLIIILVKRILKDHLNAQWHYFIWLVLILKLLIPFGPESAISLFNVMPEMPQQNMTQMVYELEQQHENDSVSESPLPYEPPAQQQIKAAKTAALSIDLLSHIWISGAAFMLLWLIIAYYLFQRKLRQGSFRTAEKTWAILEKCKVKIGIDKTISLVMQNAIGSPSLIGIIKPKILFPAVSNLSEKEIEYILLHELVHYKRKDLLVNYLLLGLQIIHWFNPVIWYCFKRIREDMEIATDERVLSILDHTEHKDYGEALLAVLEGFSASKLTPRLLGMVDNKKTIKRRLKMIKMADFFNSKKKLVLVVGMTCLIVLSTILLTNGLSKQSSIKNSSLYDAEILFKYKTAYVGDNSQVINLIDHLPYSNLRQEISLQTKVAPYGITVNYDFAHADMDTAQMETTLHHNTVLLFILIDNVDVITYNIMGTSEQPKYQYSRAEIQKNFAHDLREYAKDIKTFKEFVHHITFKLVVYPEKYTATMSSTPGIRIKAEYQGSVENVRYSTENGVLFTWIDDKISKGVKTKELPYHTPIYWSPLDEKNSVGKDNVVTVKILDEKGKTIAEKQLNIYYDGSFYTVKPALDIVMGTETYAQTKKNQTIDEAISLTLLNRSKDYLDGEVATEGHIILETEKKDGQIKAYIIASSGQFGFENGVFTKISGSGAIPRVITFSKNEMGAYSLIEYTEPMDGAGYSDSIKKMFPKRLWNKVFDANEQYKELARQEKVQAAAYLKTIGRKAEVSAEYVEKELAQINVQAANKLIGEYTKYDSFLNACPYWLGTREQIENGVRYIYEKTHSKTNDNHDLITFRKRKSDGTVIIERKYKIVGSEPQLLKPTA